MYEDIKTACLYVRFSSHNQTEQSIEGQTRVCRDFCKRHNIRIVEIYADRATSASKDIEKRVQFLKMIKDSEKGLFDAVIVYKLDRGVYTFHDYRAEDAIPAIIDKDLWDRVQLRVGKIKNAPAKNKAKVVYLLSGKIFCGHCGSKMNGNCNAGNYCYYQCYGKKNGNVDCKKKNIRKEFIERLVAQDALSLLTDEYIEQIATIACEKNQHEIELDSALPTIRDRIHQVDLSLNHLLKAIESGSAPDMLVKRMGELEKEKKDLQAQAKKESEDIVELDKAQVIYWLEQFRGGSIEDEEFCRMLIDLFVNSVTVWDEDDNTYKVTVAYNLTSLPTKTYRLNKGGTLSDFASNAPGMSANPTITGNLLIHTFHCRLKSHSRKRFCDYDTFLV